VSQLEGPAFTLRGCACARPGGGGRWGGRGKCTVVGWMQLLEGAAPPACRRRGLCPPAHRLQAEGGSRWWEGGRGVGMRGRRGMWARWSWHFAAFWVLFMPPDALHSPPRHMPAVAACMSAHAGSAHAGRGLHEQWPPCGQNNQCSAHAGSGCLHGCPPSLADCAQRQQVPPPRSPLSPYGSSRQLSGEAIG